MENVRKHLTQEHEGADKAYWNLYSRHEELKKKLAELQHDLIWIEKDIEKCDADRKYYKKLLDELNEQKDGQLG
jgi:septal ring factor EnvC (AmiA/AmiB activator)